VSVTVLVVDDDRVSRRLIRDILESAEFVVQEAADGPEGVAQAERLQPDLILLDILMPGLDGYETCARLQTRPETRAIPVVFVTSSQDPTVNHRAYALGAVGCVPKPFRREALVAMVQTALGGRLPHPPSA
jgi:CheY-like chemotaxis protein